MIKKLKFIKNKNSVWIVGGYIRDLVLRKTSKDIDFVTEGNAKKTAQLFAKKIKGTFITLDDYRKIYRVVADDWTYDFSKKQGKNITEDLSRRDFTINAIALQITNYTRRGGQITNLIDPFGGMADLKHKHIRAISEKNFIDDPLRILRTYRFAGQLNFKIEPRTEKLVKKYTKRLKSVSPERIRNELFLTFESAASYPAIVKIYQSGILNELTPELVRTKNTARCYYPKLGVLGHSFNALKVLEKFYSENFKSVFKRFSGRINSHLENRIGGPKSVKRKTLLKLAVLLHDIGKTGAAKKIDNRLRFFGHEDIGIEIINAIGKRLKLSNDEIKYIKNLTKHHMRLGNLTSAQSLTDKAAWRYFRDLGNDAIDLIVLSVTDAYTYPKSNIRTLHKIIGNKLLAKYFDEKKKVFPVKLLNGFEIMKILKIPEGPAVGKILRKLEEAQVTKKIKTKDEAKKFIRHIKINVLDKNKIN
ncbi:MAG: CCA tRNA nucleotidyltransferase [Elusimicrobia bacterium]|nr:CCA tRNA nucleotidyltransferase [Elusimicrobiota bacterium]